MGIIVPIWSYKHGWGQTSIAASLAFQMNKLSKYKIILIDSNFRFNDLADFMNIKNTVNNSVALDKMISSETASETENVTLNAMSIKNTNIDIFCGSKILSFNTLEQLIQQKPEQFDNFINALKKSYDIILWDLNSGFYSDLTNYILKESEAVLNIVKQFKNPLMQMEKTVGYDEINRKMIYIINQYDEEIGFDIGVIKEFFKVKVFTLPYASGLVHYSNEKNLEAFIMQKNKYTIQLNKISEMILNTVEEDKDEKKIVKTNSTVFSSLFTRLKFR